jgi:ribosomal protein L11 methyltransferase
MRPDRWLFVEITSPSAELGPLLAEGLIASGGTAVEERDDRLRTWLPPPADAQAFVTGLAHALQSIAGQAVPISWEWRADEDWTVKWREGLAARRVGCRTIVTPSWISPERRPGDVVIVIDPQMAFGTGEHASTRGALRLLEWAARPGAIVLDAGTGSGILAIAAALLGAARVDAVDYDGSALGNAVENVARNGCTSRVRIREVTVDPDYLAGTAAVEGPYDMILANLLSNVLMPLLPGFRTVLRPGGTLVMAGILECEADAIIEAAAAESLQLAREDRDMEWWSGAFHHAGSQISAELQRP